MSEWPGSTAPQDSGAAPGWNGPVPEWGQQFPAPGPGYPQPGWPVPGRRPGNAMAVASLVLGITSIIFSWWGLLTLAQVVLALVFGVKGIGRANRGASGKGMAVAGVVCGSVGAVVYLLFGFSTLGIGFVI